MNIKCVVGLNILTPFINYRPSTAVDTLKHREHPVTISLIEELNVGKFKMESHLNHPFAHFVYKSSCNLHILSKSLNLLTF